MLVNVNGSGHETAIAAASQVWGVLAQNQYRAYGCDPEALLLDGPYRTKEWEQDALYICKLAGLWMDSVWVQHPTGSYKRITIRDGKAFISDIAAVGGEFSKVFYTTH